MFPSSLGSLSSAVGIQSQSVTGSKQTLAPVQQNGLLPLTPDVSHRGNCLAAWGRALNLESPPSYITQILTIAALLRSALVSPLHFRTEHRKHIAIKQGFTEKTRPNNTSMFRSTTTSVLISRLKTSPAIVSLTHVSSR